MSERVASYLQPVSETQPCGPDLSYDPRFDELENTLQGKPEVEIGNIVRPAEPPEWRLLTKKAEALSGQTKHLRVAVVVGCCWLKLDGLPGFRDGLLLIRGLLENYWTPIYPLLDPEDDNDPTQRLNILRALTAPRGSVSGWMTFLDYLMDAPLAQPKGGAAITYAHVVAARKKAEAGGEGASGGSDEAQITSALRSAGAEQLLAIHDVLEGAIDAVRAIDELLTSTLGASESISFEVLQGTLRELRAVIAPHLRAGPSGPVSEASAAETVTASMVKTTITLTGAIRSRLDVIRALDAICDYYHRIEPGSPVPFLLRRAQKLAAMNFVQAMQELNLANLEALRPSMGSALDSSESPSSN